MLNWMRANSSQDMSLRWAPSLDHLAPPPKKLPGLRIQSAKRAPAPHKRALRGAKATSRQPGGFAGMPIPGPTAATRAARIPDSGRGCCCGSCLGVTPSAKASVTPKQPIHVDVLEPPIRAIGPSSEGLQRLCASASRGCIRCPELVCGTAESRRSL